ncbi:YdeI/OmpD-associated family protein, partial [Staphylococcus aureus]|nr:YdeI/OmpD-associated family protein [Staphylococcus aureus]
IGQAKRSETRQKRVEKYINQILEGKGMHDK